MSKSTDYPQDEGITRQLVFANEEAAVIDVTPEFVVVNWTSYVNVETFIELITANEEPPPGSDSWFRFASQTHEGRTSFSSIRSGMRAEYTESCRFLRVDVSESRSVAWDTADAALPVIGLGDARPIFASGEIDVLRTLIRDTATPSVVGDEVVESAVVLARDYGEGVKNSREAVYS